MAASMETCDILLNISSDNVISQFKSTSNSNNETLSGFIRKRLKERIVVKDDNPEKDERKKKRLHSNLEGPQSKKRVVSLFKHNPDIPEVDLKHVKPKEECLFSSNDFSTLALHSHLVSCLRDRMNLTRMTSVQSQVIPILLRREDALVKSLTGSGKTLVYSVPIVQTLQNIKPPLTRKDGVRALVIVPSRELAIQSYECFETLCRAFTWIVPGYLMGGEKKKSEKARIRKGLGILVGTPGRILDHLQSTANLDLSQLQWLVIDEADRLLELGFENVVSQIVERIQNQQAPNTERTTALLSATLSKDVERLAGLTLCRPHLIDLAATEFQEVLTSDQFAVPKDLQQRFIICPLKLRLAALSAYLVDRCISGQLKSILFMAAQDVVDFHLTIFQKVLSSLLPQLQFFRLHGNMDQRERVKVFKEFREANSGVLLCTDVASRGLDIPLVEEVIQFSVPCNLEDYVHRAGRTARAGSKGRCLLFLLPSEVAIVEELRQHAINMEKLDLNDVLPNLKMIGEKLTKRRQPHTVEEHATALQDIYEHAVASSEEITETARKGFMSYTRAYASYPRSLRHAVPFHGLHLGHAAKSFCLQEAPSELAARFKDASSRFSEQQQRFQRREQKWQTQQKQYTTQAMRRPSTMKGNTPSYLKKGAPIQQRKSRIPFSKMSEYDSGF